MTEYRYPKFPVLVPIAVIALVVIGVFALLSGASVGVGDVALVVDPLSGTVSNPVVGPRWFVKLPYQSVVKVPYSTQYLILSDSDPNADFASLMCFSSEGIEVKTDVVVRFGIDVNKAAALYQSYPAMNWELTTINSITSETTKGITKNYTWIEIKDKRVELANQIQAAIVVALSDEPSLKGAIINIEVDLKNVAFPQTLVNELQATVAAQQAVVTAENQRKSALILANATAQTALIQAQGEANAQVARAKGEADAIQQIIAVVGQDGWQTYYNMQKLKEISPNIGTLIVGMDGNFLVPLK
ncbi:MAG: SPFH domain-containing protein [Candidatus Bathyarchaeota archaeon]|nr:SPFH domain-containing protein [Candidatus Bathyarchaeota archaeon]